MAGDLVHFEIPAKDTDRAQRFYGSLLGWTFKDSGMPGIEYKLTEGTHPGGAVMKTEDGKAGLVIYFETADIEASIKKVRDLGGMAHEKGPVPGQGWFSGCTDTEGNAFSLWQADPTVTMEQANEWREAQQMAEHEAHA